MSGSARHQTSDEDFYFIDGFKVWEKFRSLQEKPYIESIRTEMPDWDLLEGPYCPGKVGHLTYKVAKDGVELYVHVRDGDYAITKENCKNEQSNLQNR